jgi:hypothetical protein
MCGSKTGRFSHANSNVLFIRSFFCLLWATFSGRNRSFRAKTKKERRKDKIGGSESTNGTLPAAVNAFYLSGQQREMLRSPFPLIHNSDLRNFSDGHKNYGTSMRRLRLCGSYCIIHE